MDTILVLDCGGQTCQLIARRIRELGVYTEVAPSDILLQGDAVAGVKGIVVSGSPFSVHDQGAPQTDSRLLDVGVPVLGICYGMQHVMHRAGGRVSANHVSEYGRSAVTQAGTSPLFATLARSFVSWMSHGDAVEEVAVGFDISARSEHQSVAAVESSSANSAPFYGLQFHPEVTHTENGVDILRNFAVDICGASSEWSVAQMQEQAVEEIRAQVGARPVVLMFSGGVDSAVVAALLLAALPAEQVHLLYVDTGLMRAGETDEVRRTLAAMGATNLRIVAAEARFLDALAGLEEPERKRQIIGDLFIEVQAQEIGNEVADAFLAQGTLYTDLIESGRGVGNKADIIKSHHNVASPMVAAKRDAGLLVEPLAHLYKDEVRRLGRSLGVPEQVVGRHPFPGPGLGVRILGEVTRERCDLLRAADAIYMEELHSRGLYDRITQAFAVLLPVRSVGVTGDSRSYGSVVALRAVQTADFMTADVYPFDIRELVEIGSRITNEVAAVGRVVYDVSSKPPATVEWE